MSMLPDPPPADPVVFFQQLFARARDPQSGEAADPTAVALATASADGRPAVRMVLFKGSGADADGFVFFTNYDSRKSHDLQDNPHAALCFYWPVLHHQVRVEGTVTRVSAAESDAYFQTRPRDSQLAAWSSRQSAPLSSRAELLDSFRALSERFAGQPVPRPDFWGGFRLHPARMEFWAGHPHRMHDRLLYMREEAGWSVTRLYP